MGVTSNLGMTDAGAVVLGFVFALPAGMLSFKNRKWVLLGFVILAFAATLVPIKMERLTFQRILDSRQLRLEE